MNKLRIIFIFAFFLLLSHHGYSQCTSCAATYSANASITATANNQVICITGGTSFNFTSNYSNVTLKVCAPNVTFSYFEVKSSASNNRIETWGINTDLQNLSVDADTFFFTTHVTGAKVSSATINKRCQFNIKANASLDVVPTLNPGEKIFFYLDAYAKVNAAGITSNRGGAITLSKGAVFNSSGTVFLQNDGYLYNTGTLNIAGDMTVQGGANAMNNYCGEGNITIGGTFIINNGTIRNGGSIKAGSIRVNAGGGPILPKKGSTIEATTLESFNEPNLFRGDSIPSGDCSLFKISNYGSWNGALANSSKIHYCGPAVSAARLGSATASCTCTSALSDCNFPCTKPDAGADATACTSGATADLKDATGTLHWYAASDNPASATIGKYTGMVSGMTQPGIYKFVIRDTTGSLNATCLDTAVVTVNKLPSAALTITGGVVCNTQTNAAVLIQNAEPGVTYRVKLGNTEIGSATNNSNSAVNLTVNNILTSSLTTGINVVTVDAEIPYCTVVTLTDTAALVKNNSPSSGLTVNGNMVCSNVTPTGITILNAEPGVTYSAYLGGTLLDTRTNTGSTPVNLPINNISTGSLADGLNIITVRADIQSCSTVNLTDTAAISKVPTPSSSLTVNGNIVCSNQTNTTIRIVNAEPDVTYTALLGGNAVGSATNNSAASSDLDVSIPVALLNNGTNVINVRADIYPCASVNLTDTAAVIKVPDPSASLTVTGSTVCSNVNSTTITIQNAEPNVTYSAYLGTTKVGFSTNGTSVSDLDITIPTASLPVGQNTIHVEADIYGCSTVALTDTARVTKVANPDDGLVITGSTVCSNVSTTSITVQNAEPFVTYSAYLGETKLGEATNGSSAGNLSVSIPTASLANGTNIINVRADLSVCLTVSMTDTAAVIKIPNPASNRTVNGNIVCSNQTSTFITILNAQPNVTYSAYLGTTKVGEATNGNTAGNLNVTIPTAALSNGMNVITVRANLSVCATVNLTDTAGIRKVPNPSSALTINGNVVCSNQNSTTITIINAEPNVTYSAFIGTTQVGTGINTVNTPTTINITIPTAELSNGLNVINVKADIAGCATVNLTDTAGVTMVPNPSGNLQVNGNIVCSNLTTTSITILNAEPDVTYSAYRGTTKVGSATATSLQDLSISIPVNQLVNGMNIINVTADISGCATVALSDTAGIRKVPQPSSSLTISGGIICSNQDSAAVMIHGAEPNVSYSLFLGSTFLNSGRNNSNSSQILTINVPVSLLSDGKNTISAAADIYGCSTVNLTDTADIHKVPNPDASLTINGGIICSNQSNSSVIVLNSEPGVTYTAFIGATPVGNATNNGNTSANLTITIPVNRLATGMNVIRLTAEISGCTTVNMTDTAGIRRIPNPSAALTVNGSILCSSDASSTSVTILNAEPNVTYSAWRGGTQIGSSVNGNSTSNLVISFPTSSIVDGINTINVRANINGCATVNLTDTATVTLDPEMTPGAIAAAQSTVCSGTSPELLNTQLPTGGLSLYTYIWQYSIDGSNWTNIAGSNTPGPLKTAPSITENTQYRRFVRSRVCTAVTSTQTVAVTGQMVGGGIQATSNNVCLGLVPGIINSTAPATGGTGDDLKYQWQSSSDGLNWTNISGADGIDYQPDPITIDTYFRRRASNGNGTCDTTYAGPVQIQLYKTLDPGTIQSGDTTVCMGSDVTVKSITGAFNGSPTYNYIWQTSSAPYTVWSDLPDSDGLNYTIQGITEDRRFRRIVLNQCNTDTTSEFYEVKVLPNLVTDISFTSVPALICNIDQVSIVVSTENAGVNRTIDWYYNNQPFLLSASSPDSVYTDKGNWKNGDVIKVIVHADPDKLCTTPGDTAEVTLAVNNAISSNTITGSDQIACQVDQIQPITGSAAQGNLANPGYVWQISDDEISWTDIPGANEQDYKPEISTGIVYYRRIALSAGACKNDTSVSSVKVMLDGTFDPGTLTADPSNICQGVIPVFSVTSATGGLRPYTYQWEKSTDSTVWVVIDGATDSIYSSPALSQSTFFRRRVITTTDVCEYTTPAILIKVDNLVGTNSNTISGDDQVCFGSEADKINGSLPTGGLTPVTYQWIASDNGIDGWSVVADSAGQHLFPGILDKTTYYKRIITSTGACPYDTSSETVRIFVDPLVYASSINNHSNICTGSSASLTALPATGGTVHNYQWQISTDSLNWSDINGENQEQLSIQTLDETTFYRRIVSSLVCSDTTEAMAVKVDYPVEQGTNSILGDAQLCFGASAGLIDGTVPSGSSYSPSYQWICSPDGIGNWTIVQDSVREDFLPGILTQTTYFKRIVTSTGACDQDTSSGMVKIFIDPLVNAESINSHSDICSGSTASLVALPATGGTEHHYQWQSSVDNQSWNDINGETGEQLSAQILNSTTYFRRIVSSVVCKDTTAVMVVNVDNPVEGTSNDISGSSDICFGSNAPEIIGSVPNGGIQPPSYRWIYSTDNVSWTELSDSVRKNLSPGAISTTTWYKRIVTSTGACGYDTSMGSYKVFVDPEVNPGLIGDDQQFCDKPVLSLSNITDATGGTFISYTWQVTTESPNTGNWQNLSNGNGKDVNIVSTDLPKAENLYFRRIASSSVCSEASNIVSVVPCLKPGLIDLYPAGICMNTILVSNIVAPEDFSRNGGSLFAMSVPYREPQYGTVSIDSINNTFTYIPFSGFSGLDVIEFTVCDTTRFNQCDVKKVHISVLDTNRAPVIINDSYSTFRNMNIWGNLLSNDSDPDNDSLVVNETVVIPPQNGILTVYFNGQFEYIPNKDYKGSDSAVVQVCDYNSVVRCDQILCGYDTVYFLVKPNGAFIPEGFSPNDDGKHDTFIINTEAPSRISIMLYNRWGNVVYENKDYKNDWDGIGNRGLIIGKGVPDGTYYLYYNINDGEFEGFKYITINR